MFKCACVYDCNVLIAQLNESFSDNHYENLLMYIKLKVKVLFGIIFLLVNIQIQNCTLVLGKLMSAVPGQPKLHLKTR